MLAPSYSHGTSTTPLLGDTIGDHFQRTAARSADRQALVGCRQDVKLTYGQLDAAMDAAAGGLLRAGIRTGDRVGIWAPNCVEWVIVQYATAKIGAILVNINPAYRTHELEYVLREAGVRLLFSASTFKTSDYAAMIDEVSPGLDALERTIFVDRP
jgi:fatty-acyl-CoA synthase